MLKVNRYILLQVFHFTSIRLRLWFNIFHIVHSKLYVSVFIRSVTEFQTENSVASKTQTVHCDALKNCMQTPKSISDSQIAQFSDRQLSSDWIRKRFRWTKTTADRLRYMERTSQCIVWFLYKHSNVYYLLWNFVKYTHKRWYSHLETTKWIFNNSPFISIWVGLNVDEMFTLIKPPFFDHNTFSD